MFITKTEKGYFLKPDGKPGVNGAKKISEEKVFKLIKKDTKVIWQSQFMRQDITKRTKDLLESKYNAKLNGGL